MKKMVIKFFSLVIILTVTLGVFLLVGSGKAMADGNFFIKINGHFIESGQYWKNEDTSTPTGSASDYNYYFDSDNNKLYFNNLNVSKAYNQDQYVVSINTSTTSTIDIVYKGNCTIDASNLTTGINLGSNANIVAADDNSTLNITGRADCVHLYGENISTTISGCINLTTTLENLGPFSGAINSYGAGCNINIKDCYLNIDSKRTCGIYSYAGLNIDLKNEGEIYINSTYCGMIARDITLNSSSLYLMDDTSNIISGDIHVEVWSDDSMGTFYGTLDSSNKVVPNLAVKTSTPGVKRINVDVPESIVEGQTIDLSSTVIPEEYNGQVKYSVKSAGTTGATISDYITGTGDNQQDNYKLLVLHTGTCVITATIEGGTATGDDFTKDITINVKTDINNAVATLSKSVYIYTGSQINTELNMTYTNDVGISESLEEGVDYTIDYPQAIDVGKNYSITITGMGDFSGTKIVKFDIKKDISSLNITLDPQVCIFRFTGASHGPEVIIMDGDYKLIETKDYILEFTNNTDVGTGNIAITGKGNYVGSVNKTFEIKQSIEDTIIAFNDENNGNYPYTGNAVCPEIVVTYNQEALTENKDYMLSYSNNIFGTATVAVTGMGNYVGSTSITYHVQKSFSECTLYGVEKAYKYTGQAVYPDIVVKDENGVVLTENEDYFIRIYDDNGNDNVHVGSVTMLVAGKNKYTDGIEVTFSIMYDIADMDITLDNASYTYTGKDIVPTVTVKNGDDVLTQDKDYNVQVSDNKAAGTASVDISGIGDNFYMGSIKKTFAINKATLTKDNFTIDTSSSEFTGENIEKSISGKYMDNDLKEGTDYKVNYTDNVNAGEATISVTGIGNYKGTFSECFTITAPSISVTGLKSYYTYISKAICPSVTVKNRTKTLQKDTDYTVSYSNNVNPGTATITITGIGNYNSIGKLTKSYIIIPNKMALSKAKSYKKKTLKVSWYRKSMVSGYYVVVARNKSFTSGRKGYYITKNTIGSKTIKKLKSKKIYYVKVRAYKTISGKKYYGSYSTYKKIKVK